MRNIPARFATTVALLVLGTTAFAAPIPFQVEGSDLDIDFEDGGALGLYFDNSMDSPVWLDEGESFNFHFGTYVAAAIGDGVAELIVNLATPDATGTVGDQGDLWIFSFIITLSGLDWGSPASFGYSYGGLGGGILSLNLWDVEGVTAGLPIKGTITNVQSPDTPVSVTEPGILLLLGSGLLGIAGLRRRSATRV